MNPLPPLHNALLNKVRLATLLSTTVITILVVIDRLSDDDNEYDHD